MSDNRAVEFAVGRAGMSAYRSLAAAADVDLDTVLSYVRNDSLSVLVDRIGRGNDPVAEAYRRLYDWRVLWARRGW
jgi:hypothetical protein